MELLLLYSLCCMLDCTQVATQRLLLCMTAARSVSYSSMSGRFLWMVLPSDSMLVSISRASVAVDCVPCTIC